MTPIVRGAVVAAMVGGSLVGGVRAEATPGSEITAVTLGQAQIPAGLLPFVAGTDLVVREITIGPGGSTGWHYHDGPVFGFIRSGTLTHPGPDCVAPVYRTGDFIYEPAGEWNVHIGQNLGPDPLVLDVVYAPPTGAPLFQDAPAPPCA
ncbi:cupin domain-containing protein [Nocardia bhagyanarayanae]|uniref:Quercetin dioxygenase-like cupin family protein n=1 Tax=Nocardia bhagyanarayanae TaxID=1215925 RepID=A0A543FAW1_9NOCA|nr:cupin domain-containing protein [Nocardia bhagyanarayanae]TQM30961.1 quercetin dioxygenase-like cupin family protein [Nocardia bhagyanarayanae]